MEANTKHRSYWFEQSDSDVAAFPHLMENASCDVAIVGGGITGLTAALSLCQAGKEVILIDLNRIGRGTTGHSTGHLDNHYDQKLKNLVTHFGLPAARTVINAKRHAIREIEQWNTQYRLNCGFRRVPGYYYAESGAGTGIVNDELSAANHLELDYSSRDHAPLPFETQKTMCLPEQARFSPMAYVMSLSRFIFLLGGRIYEHTRMEEFHEQNGKMRIETTHGKIEAGSLILAGHTSLTGKVSLQTRIFPQLSHVIAVEVDDRIEDALYWDTDEPYHYTRIASQDRPDLLIIGGADRHPGSEQHPNPFEQLETYARQRYKVRSVQQYWSHELFNSADGLPFVGRVPWSDSIYVAAAFSGDGLTFGTMAGTLLSDLIVGRDNPVAKIVSPERIKPGVMAPKVAKFMTHIARHYVKDRMASYDENPDTIPPGEGRLLKVDDQVHAVYRDTDGELTVMSPICRHMGCIVQWNPEEKTWDCPCHGGRYDCFGSVIMGPPRKPLKQESLKTIQAKAEH